MSTPTVYTLTNPKTGNLAVKIRPLLDNTLFDHIQRLNYYSVILLLEGRGQFSVDFADYPVTGGTVLFFAPYQPFMLRNAEDVRGIVLHFHPDFFCVHQHQKEVACNGVLFNNIYQTPVLPVTSVDMDRFLSLVEAMKSEIMQADLAQYEALISYLKLFLIFASRLKLEQGATLPGSSTDIRKTEIAQQLKEAIEEHYRARHSASDYADLLHISSKVLARITRSFYNKTITALISERIIIEAKRELYLTSKTVKEIAWLLGFEDEFYFSRFFKNNAGVSPQLFRETVGSARLDPLRTALQQGPP
jgi:AraC-like DNA-binding protein